MLHALITAFPNEGYTFYKNLDYWECKDLLEVSTLAKINPSDKLQCKKNEDFNLFLDFNATKTLDWQFLEERYNLWDIKKHTETVME